MEEVKFDGEMWQEVKNKLENFYLPKIFCKA